LTGNLSAEDKRPLRHPRQYLVTIEEKTYREGVLRPAHLSDAERHGKQLSFGEEGGS